MISAVNQLAQENEVLRAKAFPDGVEASSPQVMILRCVADAYGSRNRRKIEGFEDPAADFWLERMSGIDAIISRLDAGGRLTAADAPELEHWYELVITSSRVMPNVITFAFLRNVQMLRVEAEKRDTEED